MRRRSFLQSMVLAAAGYNSRLAWATTQSTLSTAILGDPMLNETLRLAKALLRDGLTAGAGYQEVWIRDLNTFLELALQVADPRVFRTALVNFLLLQGPDGDIVDGYVPIAKQQEPAYRKSAALPQYVAHKNTVETDQESSLVLAVAKYVSVTRDVAFLDVVVAGEPVRKRLSRALNYPLTHRVDASRGLVWGGTTIDWGDVAPERLPGTRLFPTSHRALGIYHNALLISAIRAYLQLPGTTQNEQRHWSEKVTALKAATREHLWDTSRQKFRPHVYLDGSPFASSFDEQSIYLHGGTTVAMEADMLSRSEVLEALERMRANVRAARAASIGLTIYPPYPEGFYADPILTKPYTYQNGGDWCWFGGRTVQQLIRLGMLDDAYLELRPMVARVVRTKGFHEWWTPNNMPQGSSDFRGSAGVLGIAIQQLQAAVSKT